MHRARSSAPPRSTPIRLDLCPLEAKPQGGISGVDLKNISQQQSQSRLQRPDGTTCQCTEVSVDAATPGRRKAAILVKLLVVEQPQKKKSWAIHKCSRGCKRHPHRLITRCECASDPGVWAHSSSSARDNTVRCASCREVGRAHRLCTPE